MPTAVRRRGARFKQLLESAFKVRLTQGDHIAIKISYCITCMGRLWQLRQTLPWHLDRFRGRQDVEFVLLDYNSEDGLEEWVRSTTCAFKAIKSGLMIYSKECSAKNYSSPKAKNLAHRMAKGDVLFNLDADNWADIDQELRNALSRSSRILVHSFREGVPSTCGRVGIWREWFFRLGGYDEMFEPVAYQDKDLIYRVEAAGGEIVSVAPKYLPINNSHTEKVRLAGSTKSLLEMVEINRRASETKLEKGELVANKTGWGAGIISINFNAPVRLRPIVPNAFVGLSSMSLHDQLRHNRVGRMLR